MLLGNLDSLQALEQDCLMEFKPAKCEAITFTKKTKSMKAEYRLYDVILTAVTSAKYLGVHISSKLFWSTRQYDCQEGYSSHSTLSGETSAAVQHASVNSVTKLWLDLNWNMPRQCGTTPSSAAPPKLKLYSEVRHVSPAIATDIQPLSQPCYRNCSGTLSTSIERVVQQ